MTPGGGPQVQQLKESDELEINRQGELFLNAVKNAHELENSSLLAFKYCTERL